jgi:hypothetical protein
MIDVREEGEVAEWEVDKRRLVVHGCEILVSED